MANEIIRYVTTNQELTSIADAIRTKGGTSETLNYPSGFVSAIDNIYDNFIEGKYTTMEASVSTIRDYTFCGHSTLS